MNADRRGFGSFVAGAIDGREGDGEVDGFLIVGRAINPVKVQRRGIVALDPPRLVGDSDPAGSFAAYQANAISELVGGGAIVARRCGGDGDAADVVAARAGSASRPFSPADFYTHGFDLRGRLVIDGCFGGIDDVLVRTGKAASVGDARKGEGRSD